MAIHCPACGVVIHHLRHYSKVEALYYFYGGGQSDYQETFYDYFGKDDFECPSCNELLFHDEEQASKFMAFGDLYPWKGVDDYGQKDQEYQQGSTGNGDPGVLEQGSGTQTRNNGEG